MMFRDEGCRSQCRTRGDIAFFTITTTTTSTREEGEIPVDVCPFLVIVGFSVVDIETSCRAAGGGR